MNTFENIMENGAFSPNTYKMVTYSLFIVTMRMA